MTGARTPPPHGCRGASPVEVERRQRRLQQVLGVVVISSEQVRDAKQRLGAGGDEGVEVGELLRFQMGGRPDGCRYSSKTALSRSRRRPWRTRSRGVSRRFGARCRVGGRWRPPVIPSPSSPNTSRSRGVRRSTASSVVAASVVPPSTVDVGMPIGPPRLACPALPSRTTSADIGCHESSSVTSRLRTFTNRLADLYAHPWSASACETRGSDATSSEEELS